MPHATTHALLFSAALLLGGCKFQPGSGFASAAGADAAHGPVSCDCSLLVDVAARPEYPRMARPRVVVEAGEEAVCEYGPSGAAPIDGTLSVVVRPGDRQAFESAMARATSGAVKTLDARRISVMDAPGVEAYEALALLDGGTTRRSVAFLPQRGLVAEMTEPLARGADAALAEEPSSYLAALAQRAGEACR